MSEEYKRGVVEPLRKPREKRDRQTTEENIVRAFEAVMLREGVEGLGVNAVAQEAGVNKVLIYRYFGGLPGLARHWVSNSTFWPTALELIGNDEVAFARLPVRQRIRTVLVNYIDAIRARPQTVEMLAAELMSPSEITRAFADALVRPGQSVADFIRLEDAETDLTEQVWNLIYIVNGLASYLAIRERNNPTYLGMDLNDDDSWDYLRNTVGEIADRYLAE
ncbi:MAG: TetR/AcrR family transcriptional regulator [Gammaproteobacteria bacterium]|nr:TetR/AcrR family transcriptional regulator [Gammaproteobacteria bacterium]NND54799.1 TetR/AcrR family transcriptional regulator [Gammaproteobacteria bacterium]